MNHTSRLFITMISSCAALAGCGGSSGVTTTRLYAVDVGTAANALADGKTLTTQTNGSSAVELNFDNGDTGPFRTPTVKVWKNANGEFSYSVDGVVQDFTEADRYLEGDGTSYGYDVNGGDASSYSSLFLFTSGTLDEVLDESATDYSTVWGYQTNQVYAGEPNLRGFAVVGSETLPADIKQLPSATYSGRSRIDTYPATGFVNNETSRTRVRSDVTLNADFGAATIAGQMYNITVQAPGGTADPIAGVINMNEAPISGNGFAGTLTPNDELIAAVEGDFSASGTYGGTFYGPAAEEASGTITWYSSVDGNERNGVGFFQTFKE